MNNKLFLSAPNAATSPPAENGCIYFSESDEVTVKIKKLLSLLRITSAVTIEDTVYIHNITGANNLYFYTLNEDTLEITNEYMILTEAIIEIKLLNSNTFKIISENNKAIIIHI